MSNIYKKGVSPQTRAIHSSRNMLFAVNSSDSSKPNQIGVVSNFAPQDSRELETVRGIGFGDQIAELVPQMSQAITATLNRTALYQMNIFQALGYKGGIDGLVRALKHHRWPFDLRQEIVISDAGGAQGGGSTLPNNAGNIVGNSADEVEKSFENKTAIATLYAGCWLNSYSATYSADTAIIAEDVSLTVTDIFAWAGNLQLPGNALDNLGSGKGKSQIFQ